MVTGVQIYCATSQPCLNAQSSTLWIQAQNAALFVESNFQLSRAVERHESVLEDSEVDGVLIATPAASHFSLAKQALNAGKHVFVEKPLATKVAEVDELSRCASEQDLVVMTGHTFVYNSAVRYVKKLIDAGELGELRYIYSQRLNLGRIRSDIDALWNFAPHDISIIQYWLGDPEPISIGRQGMAYMQDGIDDVVFLNSRVSRARSLQTFTSAGWTRRKCER